MVIEVNIVGWIIGNVLIDNGSSADIIFTSTFQCMGLAPHMLAPPEKPLVGFGGKLIRSNWKISLPVSFEDLDNARVEHIMFDVVDMYYPYSAIFGRGFINRFGAVSRQLVLCMKIPTPHGIITIFGDQNEARRIERGNTPGLQNVHHLADDQEKQQAYSEAKRDKDKTKISADGETKRVFLDGIPDRAVMIGADLSPQEEEELICFLNQNKDVFAWSTKDLQGVDQYIIEHRLDTDDRILPKKQNLRKCLRKKQRLWKQKSKDYKMLKLSEK
jgi:hypothetical protein